MCGCTPWWPSARPSWCSSSSPSTSCGASLPCTARALLFLHILDREYFRWLHLLCITGVGGWCLSKQSVDNSLHSVSFGSYFTGYYLEISPYTQDRQVFNHTRKEANLMGWGSVPFNIDNSSFIRELPYWEFLINIALYTIQTYFNYHEKKQILSDLSRGFYLTIHPTQSKVKKRCVEWQEMLALDRQRIWPVRVRL